MLTPTISAIVLSGLIDGKEGIRILLAGFTLWKVSAWWYLAAFMMTGIPLLVAGVYLLLGNPVEGVQPGTTFWSLLSAAGFTFLNGPLAEEAGWRGFALPRLQEKFNALKSSLLLGFIWACWHIPFYLEPGYAEKGMPLIMFIGVVTGLSILFTWIFNNSGGSLVLTVLAHFFFNFSSAILVQRLRLMPPMWLFMGGGGLMILLIFVVIVYFGPKFLSKKQESDLPIQHAISAQSITV